MIYLCSLFAFIAGFIARGLISRPLQIRHALVPVRVKLVPISDRDSLKECPPGIQRLFADGQKDSTAT